MNIEGTLGARSREAASDGEVAASFPFSIGFVNPIGATLIALVVGIIIGGFAVWIWSRRKPFDDAELRYTPPAVPDGVGAVLAALRSSAIVVGPHDEVLQASTPAHNLGLVRGSRVVNDDLLRLVREVRQSKESSASDLQIEHGRGIAATYLSARVAPLDDEMVLVLAEDLTTQRRIDATRRDFVANVSHELKTPIGAVSLLAEAIEDGADDPVAVRRFASRLSLESARLIDLTAQIIDLSRLQADDPLAHPEEVDVDEVLADAVDRCRVDAEQHQVELTVAGERNCRVLGSDRMLSVAISNLVENAVIYSDPGARVVVAAHRVAASDDDYIEITVSDNGIGIPPNDQERIFERFYRVDYARSRADGGTGLGLAIVKHIAASHRGDVAVWSQVGQGSTFTIKIPAHLKPGTAVDQGLPDLPATRDPAMLTATERQPEPKSVPVPSDRPPATAEPNPSDRANDAKSRPDKQETRQR